jgi:hypothetical protein
MLPPTVVLMKRQCLHQGCLALLLNLDPKLIHRSYALQRINLFILMVRSGFLLFSPKRFMALSVMTNTFNTIISGTSYVRSNNPASMD